MLNGDRSKRIIEIAAKAGETITLSSTGSNDPDGNATTSHWMVYPEARTFNGSVDLSRANGVETKLTMPASGPRSRKSPTIHVILSVQDNGEPSLVAYRRAIITAHAQEP